MVITQMEADMSALGAVNVEIESRLADVDKALEIVGEISKFGITKTNYDELKEIYPELSNTELNLSSMPIPIGGIEIGNEAAGALGGMALAAILTALAGVIGWILSKLFGGSSSMSGGGGGSIPSLTKELSDKKMGYESKHIIESLEKRIAKKLDGDDPKKLKRDIDEAKATSISLEMISNGYMDSLLSFLTDSLKDIRRVLKSTVDSDGTYGAIGSNATSKFNKFVEDNRFVSKVQKGKVTITPVKDGEDSASLATTRKSDLTKISQTSAYVTSRKDYTDNPDINASKSLKVAKDMSPLKDDLTSLANEIKKKPPTGDTKLVSAIQSTLYIYSKYIGNIILPPLALMKSGLSKYLDECHKAIVLAVDVVESLDATQKKTVLRGAGVSEDEWEKIKSNKAVDKWDVDSFEKCANIFDAMKSGVSIPDAQKDKIKKLTMVTFNN